MPELEIPPLCRRIREARESVGLSQEEAARKLHMSLGGYAAYERSREPKPKRAREIAAAFGLDPSHFEQTEPAMSRDGEIRDLQERLADVQGKVAQILKLLQGESAPARTARRRSG